MSRPYWNTPVLPRSYPCTKIQILVKHCGQASMYLTAMVRISDLPFCLRRGRITKEHCISRHKYGLCRNMQPFGNVFDDCLSSRSTCVHLIIRAVSIIDCLSIASRKGCWKDGIPRMPDNSKANTSTTCRWNF